VQKKNNLKAYPRDAESRIVARDIELLKKHPKARYHVLHVTTQESLELIEKAKNDGLNVSGEVSPHHLYFCAEDIQEENYSFKMNPPLFADSDREKLREALKTGLLSFVATDHAPHEEFSKCMGWNKAPFGTIGLETSLRLLLKMLQIGVLKNEGQLVEVFSSAPARFLNVEDRYGCIAAGRPFEAIIFDHLAPEKAFMPSEIQSLSKNSIFLGQPLPGRVLGHFNSKGFFRF
jgi:dihydroorotase